MKAKANVYVDGVFYAEGDEVSAEHAKLITNDAVLDKPAPASVAKK